MHNTIGRIAGKINDYKICISCGQINWYENDYCINCDTIPYFRPMTEQDAEMLLRDYNDDECEIDV